MRRLLFLCGILSSLVFISADLLSAAAWKGYSYSSQVISELMAIHAVSRPVAIPLFVIYDMLVITFGSSLLIFPFEKRLRLTGGLIIGAGITSLITTLFFPMHLRTEAATISDTMHIIFTGVTTLLMLLAIVSAAAVYGKRFRYYSICTVVILLVFGALAGLDVPKIADGQPTPWLGLTERVTIGAYVLWMAVLSVKLLFG
ncbi:MAG TPA: DUF998 domain-containing protein [Chitinophaga sp.]